MTEADRMAEADPMTEAEWTAALDQLDADLAATEAALTNGAPQSGRVVPAISETRFPTTPIPAELAPRAEDLLRRTRLLETRATEETEGIQGALRALAGRPPKPRTRTGRIVDVGA